MKKISVLFIFILIISAKLFAQSSGDKKIDNLVFLYVDEKYDKAVYKGEAMMQSDKYKRHPLVYVYTAMSYYEMSRRPGKYDVGEKDAKFPKPLKMAQKYLYKFIKTDAKAQKYYKTNWKDDFKEFYVQIADTSNKLGNYLFLNEKYSKSASQYKYAFRAVPDDPILLLWMGIAQVKAKNAVEGDKNIVAALKKIDKDFVPSKATSGVLAHGMLIVEEHLRKKGDYTNADKAKKLIDVFKKYDPDELDKKKMEERKKNTMKDDRIMRKFYSDENDEENKNRKGKVIIKDGEGSSGNSKSADEKLDELERLEKGGGK